MMGRVLSTRVLLWKSISNPPAVAFRQGLAGSCDGEGILGWRLSSLARALSSCSNGEGTGSRVSGLWGAWGPGNGEGLAMGVRRMSTEEERSSKKDGNGRQNGGDDERRDETSLASKHHHSTKIDGGKKYSVVQINSDGSWRTVCRNAADLGIHPRDVGVLAVANPFISQRSTITVHNDKIMVRMENVRALLCKDHVFLFEARRPRAFRECGLVGAAPSIAKSREDAETRARELFAVYMSQQAQEPIGHPLDAMPFHLRMMECLLDDTSAFFYQKTERLKVVVERMLEELTGDVNMGGLQRLLPLKRALTEVEHDVRDTHHAMEQVLNDDDILEAICLNKTELHWPLASDSSSQSDNGTSQQPTLRQAAADMILTYQRQIDNAGGALEELRKNIDATQEIWELGLDTTRNRIIQMDLLFSLGTLSLSISALVASYFGMNLPRMILEGSFSSVVAAIINTAVSYINAVNVAIKGQFMTDKLIHKEPCIEEDARAFWWVVSGSIASTFTIGAILVFLVRIWPRVIDRRRAQTHTKLQRTFTQDLSGLRDLLLHLDDIDDIFQAVAREVAGRAVTQTEFKKILHSHPSAKFMQQRELDLMFRMFDTNRDGLLEETEFGVKKDKKRGHQSTSTFTQGKLP